ncbi:hypothetical protein [Cysteiniphilum sp. 6C5]|uniref:hypothetical protein n=1 Tax=unclassified Cysteiniphilum TaxID=2610889 RepID=UPI003F84DAC2
MNQIKKVMLLSAASLLCISAYADSNTPSESTISFSKSSEIVVKSTTALVNVIVNATALQGDNTIIQKAAIQNLSGVLPKIDWKVVDYKEKQADSGAQNIRLVIQARLTSEEIKTLQKELKNNNSNNSRFKVEVVNFDPTAEMLDQAKDNTMISMYQSIEQYVNDFNHKTNSHYFIRSVNYSVSQSSVEPRAVMYTKVNMLADAAPKDNDNLSVSKKMVMNAYVTLAQKDNQYSTAKDANMKTAQVLPPAYLQVAGFKQCLQTVDKGTWSAWCMPKTQPQGCSDASWKALNDLKAQGKLNGMDDCDN